MDSVDRLRTLAVRFSEHDESTLTRLRSPARLIRSATESLRSSWAAAKRARQDESLLADVVSTISASPGFRAALQGVADLLVADRADYVVSYLVTDDGELERVAVAHTDPATVPVVRELLAIAPPSLRAKYGAGAVIRTGEPVLMTEIPDSMLERAAQGEAHLAVLRRLRPLSSIVVPLLVDGRAIGALALATTETSGRRYGPEDLALVEDVASPAALFIENERRREEAEAARERAERSERRARAVEEAGHILSTSLELDQTVEEVARILARSLGGSCVVDLVEDEEIRRVATAHSDPEQEDLVGELRRWPPRPEKNEGVLRALRTRQVVVENDVSPETLEVAAHSAEHLRVIRALGARSFLIVPMIARDEVIGAVTVASADAQTRYGEFEIIFARKLTDRAAMAIDNARLYEQAQTAVRLREEVLGAVSHDLRNLVGKVKLTAQTLMDSALGEERRQEMMQRQIRMLGEAESVISDLLDVSCAEAGRLHLERESTEPGALVRDAVATFCESARRAGIRLHDSLPPDLPHGRVDRNRTLRVLYNLLSNALRFTPRGGTVEVAVEADGAGELVFRVSDSGPGIPEEQRDRLFARFWQCASASSDGAGLGLSIARTLVETQGGRIWLDSSGEGGSTFCFTVPAAEGSGS